MKKLIPFLAILASPAFAVDDAEVIQKLSPGYMSLEQKAIAAVGKDYQRLMVDAAYANVASSACQGLTFNGAETNKVFNQLMAERGGATPESMQEFAVKTSILYGTYVGMLLSESFLDTDTFCKYTDQVKAKKGGPTRFWIAQSK